MAYKPIQNRSRFYAPSFFFVRYCLSFLSHCDFDICYVLCVMCYTCISCLASTSMRCVFSVWTSKTNFSCCYRNPQDDERMIGFEEVTTEIEPLAKIFIISVKSHRKYRQHTNAVVFVMRRYGVIRATNGMEHLVVVCFYPLCKHTFNKHTVQPKQLIDSLSYSRTISKWRIQMHW